MKEEESNKHTHYLPCNVIDEFYHLGGQQFKKAPVYYSAYRVKGSLDHEALETALASCLEAHDKLKRILVQKGASWRRWFQLVWEPREVTTTDVLTFANPENLGIDLKQQPHAYGSFLYQQTIDLSKEPGIKVFCINEKEDALLIFAFHHAITDARGAVNFFETFIAEYNAIYFYRKTESRKGRSFIHFDNLYLPTWKRTVRLAKPFFSLLRYAYGSNRAPVAKIFPKGQISRAEKMVLTLKLGGQPLEKIMAFAKKNSVSFYDILLAGLYFTIRKWNRQMGQNATGRIVVYTTVGLRQRDNFSLGNFVSGIHLDLTPSERMTKAEILQNIVKRRIFPLANSAHLVPLSLLTVLSLFPLPLRKVLIAGIFKRMRFGRRKQRATMRVTNLGAVEVANVGDNDKNILGRAQLDDFFIFPADIDNVPLLGFLACNNEVYLNLAVLTSTFTYESGKAFLDLLIEEISEFQGTRA